MRTGPNVGLAWRCLAMSSAYLHVTISTVKSTSCRWVWQGWLSNCSRYTGGRSFFQSLTLSLCILYLSDPSCMLLFSSCLSLSSRVMRFTSTTELCWWQKSWFYHLCLVCLSNWVSTWPPSFHCAWRATSTTGILLISPWPDTSNPSTFTLPHVTEAISLTFGHKLCPVDCNWCLYSQCPCGAVCQDGCWWCFGSGCSGLGLWS